jgi:twinkle protein
MNVSDISKLLASQVDSVCRYLLPNGKREGAEWRVGSSGGEAGKSLGVHLAGDKAGVFADFATGEAGDLLDLWAAVRCNGRIADAIREAKAYLGIREPEFHGHTPREYKPPVIPKCRTPQGPVKTYLTGKRYLAPETIAAYQVAESGNQIVFPFKRDDRVLMVKVREAVNGASPKPTSAEQEPCLFGWQAIPDNARTVTICEGEIDAMTLYQYGYPALSVPFGGGKGAKHRWLETEFPHLERFEKIYLCFDNDKAGHEAIAEIAPRLGRHRCYRVVLPFKDANDCLQANYLAVDKYFNEAQTFDPVQLRSAADYVEEVIEQFYPSEDKSRRIFLPWEKAHRKVDLREAELSLLVGYNGSGKSQAAGQIVLDAMRQGRRACIASMELKPAVLLQRLTRQAAAVIGEVPSIPYIRAIQDWFRGQLWIFECTGTAKANELVETMEYARKRYGIDLFVIDALMKCGIDEDDYNGQKRFIEALCDFKNAHNCHVLLVHHARKTDSEKRQLSKMDVKGTGAITDLVDTVMLLWRNKIKEESQKRGEVDRDNEPDARLLVEKQRNGEGDEPWIHLWFNRATLQFLDYEHQKPRRYVAFESKEAIA